MGELLEDKFNRIALFFLLVFGIWFVVELSLDPFANKNAVLAAYDFSAQTYETDEAPAVEFEFPPGMPTGDVMRERERLWGEVFPPPVKVVKQTPKPRPPPKKPDPPPRPPFRVPAVEVVVTYRDSDGPRVILTGADIGKQSFGIGDQVGKVTLTEITPEKLVFAKGKRSGELFYGPVLSEEGEETPEVSPTEDPKNPKAGEPRKSKNEEKAS